MSHAKNIVQNEDESKLVFFAFESKPFFIFQFTLCFKHTSTLNIEQSIISHTFNTNFTKPHQKLERACEGCKKHALYLAR